MSHLFIGTGLAALIGVLVFGLLAAIQYSFSGWFEVLPFYKTRPIHVALGLCWIYFTAIGGIYYYLQREPEGRLWSPRLSLVHYGLFLGTGALILASYAAGIFGGREYLEYPPVLSIPLLVGWLLFGVIFIKSLPKPFSRLPIYLWMWTTGILIFIYAFLEAHLWLLPFFGENVIRDLTVQWKSYGSLVASWNMLTYGTAICMMYHISKDKALLDGRMVFFLFFLGLLNAFFNWGHHTYIVPAAPWLKHIAYGVSMTELIILYVVIRGWIKRLPEAKKKLHRMPYRFLFASDVWIILNLVLALAISVPAINLYTHGTHITVAHSMGSMIGINSMILLASVFFIFADRLDSLPKKMITLGTWGFYIINVSLVVFWGCLLAAGAIRGYMAATGEILGGQGFHMVQEAIRPYMIAFILPGLGLLIGFGLILTPLAMALLKRRVYSQ